MHTHKHTDKHTQTYSQTYIDTHIHKEMYNHRNKTYYKQMSKTQSNTFIQYMNLQKRTKSFDTNINKFTYL